MDSDQLTVIAITAVVATVIKEVVKWLLDALKATAAASTTTARLKSMITKRNVSIFTDILSLAAYTGLLAYLVSRPGAATPLDVLFIIGALVGVLVMVISLLYKLALAQVRKTPPSPAP